MFLPSLSYQSKSSAPIQYKRYQNEIIDGGQSTIRRKKRTAMLTQIPNNFQEKNQTFEAESAHPRIFFLQAKCYRKSR